MIKQSGGVLGGLFSSVFIGPIRKIKAGYSQMMLFDFGVIWSFILKKEGEGGFVFWGLIKWLNWIWREMGLSSEVWNKKKKYNDRERECAAASARLTGSSKWGVKTGQRKQECGDKRKSRSPSSISLFNLPHSSLCVLIRTSSSHLPLSNLSFYFLSLAFDMSHLVVLQEEVIVVCPPGIILMKHGFWFCIQCK